ncbi:MAG: MBL fold metallo-hydrolase [Ruminococcaceae bacterium]|nr:MBL fold metallo-hydrolase [Oscillospiraceae bacterium]
MKFCSLYSGSSGNCIFVGDKDTKLLIDAGVSCTRIEKALREIGEAACDIQAILITHEHQDHIAGAGTLSRRFNIPIYAASGTWDKINSDKLLTKIQTENKVSISAGSAFNVGSLSVSPFNIPHDAAMPVAYSIRNDCRKISVVTDMGFVTDEIRENVFGSDLAMIESNHDIEMLKRGPHPWHLKNRILSRTGHLSNDYAADFVTYLASCGTKHFVLGHLSDKNNVPSLAYDTVRISLEKNGFFPSKNIHLSVAPRECIGEVIEI